MQTKIQGNGNIWIENVSNDIASAQVAFTGQGNFGGNTTIAKGAVTFTRGDIFSPNPGNFVTIGSTGGGDATLAGVGGGIGNIENNFVAAADSGGTLVFASNPSNNSNMNIKSTNTNAAAIRLDGDLSFDNRATNGSVFVIGNPITGVGKLTKTGVGAMRVTHTNSYQGGTVVNAGSLSVSWAAAINNGFGFYEATVGALGPGDVTVNSTATKLEIETGASANAIADTATLRLAGCDSAFGCTGGVFGTADGGFLQLGPGINEVVGALLLSSDGGENYVPQAPGTYGASGSGAANILDEYFAGPGILTVASVGAAGDFNEDGIVDAADYVVWRKGLDPSAGAPAGYAEFVENFGDNPAGSGGSNQAVPEPGTLLIAMAGVLLACASRRR
jgi:autotransporter-associated beta strand protein